MLGLKKEAPDRTVWRHGFGRGNGRDVRQTPQRSSVKRFFKKKNILRKERRIREFTFKPTKYIYCMSVIKLSKCALWILRVNMKL
jgi:hypothetical protein